MTNRNLFLLIGTSLSLTPNLIFAQCVATQDCETLGYTETSCNGGKGIKCPFGNKWACIGITAEQCTELGFTYTCTGTGEIGVGKDCSGKYQGCTCDSSYQYTCSGTGYSGGSGTACGGKYVACTCASGYKWKGSSCQINGAHSELYYCNGTVVGVKATGMNFYVAFRDLGNLPWSETHSQCASYTFCGKLKGTLPTKDQLETIYNNKSKVNSLLARNGGTQLTNDYYWSSTFYRSSDYDYYYIVGISNGVISWNDTDSYNYVRPVLTSW